MDTCLLTVEKKNSKNHLKKQKGKVRFAIVRAN